MEEPKLPKHVLTGIHAGLQDLLAGRTITLDEFIEIRAKRMQEIEQGKHPDS